MENVAPSNKAPKAVGKGGKSIEQTYTKKTQLEHILLRPDTYVGSVDRQTQPMWVLDAGSKQMVNRQVTFTPGLFKIFDEIIVNAADNKQRDPSMNRIEVTINAEEGSIRVWNNGNGIPVVIHGEHQVRCHTHLLLSFSHTHTHDSLTHFPLLFPLSSFPCPLADVVLDQNTAEIEPSLLYYYRSTSLSSSLDTC